MFGNRFYHQLTTKYVALFGTLFNDIVITRDDNREFRVPINYGPTQKFLPRRLQDDKHDAPAIVLPRMSFEIVDYQYDPDRNMSNAPNIRQSVPSDTVDLTSMSPAPYNFTFNLYVIAKTLRDGHRVIETILPYFKPSFTVSARLIDGLSRTFDIPIILNSVSKQDSYEGSPEDRREIIWTLTFTMKAYYFAHVSSQKIIKFARARAYGSLESTDHATEIRVWPGLTANGNPTTSPDDAIDWMLVDRDDEWAYVVEIEDR